MSSWSVEIEDDLKWRESELGALKLAVASTPSGTNRQSSLLRALVAMLYAHYEGFAKFCWDLLLDEIEKEGCSRGFAVDPVAELSMAKTFANFRKDTSSEAIWKFVHVTFPGAMLEQLTFPSRLETQSNLWVRIANENNKSVGIDCKKFDEYKLELNGLVGRRNDIAHGKKLVVSNLVEYEVYERAVMLALHELAVQVIDSLDKRTFLHLP